MKILFATSNPNKVEEASAVLGQSGHRVEQLLVGGVPPDFEEPKEFGLEAVAVAKIEQALGLIRGTEFEGAVEAMVGGYLRDGGGEFRASDVVSRFDAIRGRVRYHG